MVLLAWLEIYYMVFMKIANLINKKNIELIIMSLYENVGTIEVNRNIRVVGMPVAKPITLTLEMQSLLKRFGRLDVVHTHVLHYVPRFALSRIPTAYTLHGVLWKKIQYYNGAYPKSLKHLRCFDLKRVYLY